MLDMRDGLQRNREGAAAAAMKVESIGLWLLAQRRSWKSALQATYERKYRLAIALCRIKGCPGKKWALAWRTAGGRIPAMGLHRAQRVGQRVAVAVVEASRDEPPGRTALVAG
jgi:hypothetical protein